MSNKEQYQKMDVLTIIVSKKSKAMKSKFWVLCYKPRLNKKTKIGINQCSRSISHTTLPAENPRFPLSKLPCKFCRCNELPDRVLPQDDNVNYHNIDMRPLRSSPFVVPIYSDNNSVASILHGNQMPVTKPFPMRDLKI